MRHLKVMLGGVTAHDVRADADAEGCGCRARKSAAWSLLLCGVFGRGGGGGGTRKACEDGHLGHLAAGAPGGGAPGGPDVEEAGEARWSCPRTKQGCCSGAGGGQTY